MHNGEERETGEAKRKTRTRVLLPPLLQSTGRLRLQPQEKTSHTVTPRATRPPLLFGGLASSPHLCLHPPLVRAGCRERPLHRVFADLIHRNTKHAKNETKTSSARGVTTSINDRDGAVAADDNTTTRRRQSCKWKSDSDCTRNSTNGPEQSAHGSRTQLRKASPRQLLTQQPQKNCGEVVQQNESKALGAHGFTQKPEKQPDHTQKEIKS